MATLTESAYYARKAIKWSVVGLVVLVILRLSFIWFVGFLQVAFPQPELVPNNYLGKLPKINFPQVASPSSELKYTIQTISGTIPEQKDAAIIYFMPKNRSSFLSLANAQEIVATVNFTSTPRQFNDITYRWIDLNSPLRSIEMDIVNNHFTLDYAYIHDLTLFAERLVPTSEEAIQESAQLLNTMGLMPEDIDLNLSQTHYLRLVGNQLMPTTSQSQADAVRVEFFRQPYNELPIVTERPDNGIVSFILGSSRRRDRRFLEVSHHYWPVDTNTRGVYALKSSQQAWTELQQGSAYFATLPENQTQIAITDVFLAYYDSESPQLFMQPLFVFVGEPNFVAYVPAVALPWTE